MIQNKILIFIKICIILIWLILVYPIYSIEYNNKKITLYDRIGIVEIAKRYLGTPYKSGGQTPKGFDCSGFTMYVYKKAGYDIPRSTKFQYLKLKPVKIPKKGDLVFFDINGRGISHVGLYIGNFKFIHAPRTGKVVEIVDIRNPYWKKRYRGARSYFND
ncbi:MAG: hypothetical protein KatS3mg129_1520 [Leptospiraceae bacterium]|nr:MAG: hypothetical protein KatS3mg129_1520 [Leptospiraceae bacterium]